MVEFGLPKERRTKSTPWYCRRPQVSAGLSGVGLLVMGSSACPHQLGAATTTKYLFIDAGARAEAVIIRFE
jgi:hypothetical protein